MRHGGSLSANVEDGLSEVAPSVNSRVLLDSATALSAVPTKSVTGK